MTMTNDNAELPLVSRLVAEFNEAFENPKDPALWRTLIREETAELAEAVANMLKETCDLIYVMEGAVWSGVDIATLEPETLANIAGLFKWYACVFPDEIVKEAFKRVHESNMSKLGDDGKPVRRTDGKVLKGPNYKSADLMDLI